MGEATESPATRVVRFTEAMRNRCRKEDADILPLCQWCDELYGEWKRRGVSFDQAHRESLTAAVARILTEYPDLPEASPSPLAAEGKSEGEP